MSTCKNLKMYFFLRFWRVFTGKYFKKICKEFWILELNKSCERTWWLRTTNLASPKCESSWDRVGLGKMIFGARLLKSLLVIAKSMKCLRAIGHTNYVFDVYSRAITVSICIYLECPEPQFVVSTRRKFRRVFLFSEKSVSVRSVSKIV